MDQLVFESYTTMGADKRLLSVSLITVQSLYGSSCVNPCPLAVNCKLVHSLLPPTLRAEGS